MKTNSFFFLLLTILSFCLTKTVPQTNEEIALHFIECVRQALDGGLATAEVPNHNPLIVTRNLTFPITYIGTSGFLKLEQVMISNIINAQINNISGRHSNEDEIIYNIRFYYNELSIDGNYYADLNVFDSPLIANGSFNINLKNIIIDLIWDQDLESKQLMDFNIQLKGEVKFTADGFGPVVDPVMNQIISLYLTEILNKANYSALSLTVKEHLNDLWLNEEHLYRVEAIIDNCNITNCGNWNKPLF